MFESLFRSADKLARHRDGPFAEDHKRFLEHCSQAGFPRGYLHTSARMLLWIASELDASPGRSMTLEQIRSAANRWIRHRGGVARSYKSRQRTAFIRLAISWFRFLDRFRERPETPDPYSELLRDFTVWMDDECGLAGSTIAYRLIAVRRVLKWYRTLGRPFSAARLIDVDTFLAKFVERGWARSSIANEADMLRAFFRHAGRRGWCPGAIADGIKGPRLYSQERLPVGPSWEDVKRLLASLNTDDPGHIRDLPMLMLCAIYGLRPSEVARLRLEDLDWGTRRMR